MVTKGTLVLHEKVVEPDNSIIEVKVWSVPVTSDKPHGFKYSLVYIKNGERVLGFDNHEGRGDHRHFKGSETLYQFKTIDRLFEDFHEEVRRIKNES
ncbi:MAG: hypothetical protein HY202_05955 [Nitrospirae bacterium]|nr:hypothetical protein [Nitrospirota bacterium]